MLTCNAHIYYINIYIYYIYVRFILINMMVFVKQGSTPASFYHHHHHQHLEWWNNLVRLVMALWINENLWKPLAIESWPSRRSLTLYRQQYIYIYIYNIDNQQANGGEVEKFFLFIRRSINWFILCKPKHWQNKII